MARLTAKVHKTKDNRLVLIAQGENGKLPGMSGLLKNAGLKHDDLVELRRVHK